MLIQIIQIIIIILVGLIVLAGFFFVIRFGSYSGIIGDDNPFLQKDLAKRRKKFGKDNEEENESDDEK
ncbi:hypothetical protein [Paraliobacillus sp. X-1268]|uniref:hypothetical protein n=1 Tax=Paraliobacillus sp. X-1268 TaxID=2213193 RepID=UPI000E3D88E3|nr:hypothetical protein [Paraliobacillus sp. X-1268]